MSSLQVQLLCAFRQHSHWNVLKKCASEEWHACLHFPALPQVVVTGNFRITSFSLFLLAFLLPPGATLERHRGPRTGDESPLAVHIVIFGQCVHNGRDWGKGKEVILWEKLREQGKKGEHRPGPWLYWTVGQLGTYFQRKPISEVGNRYVGVLPARGCNNTHFTL